MSQSNHETDEEMMDKIIFRKGKGARYNGRIEDIRGFRLAMKKAEVKAEKKAGRWARFVGWVNTLGGGARP